MFLAAELTAMIAIQIIRQWQDRDLRLPRGSKVKHIKGTPVISFGWLRRKKAAPQAPLADSGLRSRVELDGAPVFDTYDDVGKVNWDKIVHPIPPFEPDKET